MLSPSQTDRGAGRRKSHPVPKALVFDIGGVIVRTDVERALSPLGARLRLSSQEVWKAITGDPRWQDWQEGRIEPRAWHEHLARRFGLDLSYEQFCEVWNSALGPETILSDDLFAGLSAGYRLVLLSNTDPIHVAHLETHFRFPRFFPARIYSCTAGVSKPSQDIYRRAIQDSGAQPEQILYIDDVPAYVEAGRRAGMQALLFEGAEQLLGELRQRGVLPE